MSNQHYDEHMPNKQRAPLEQQHAQQFFCDICKVQLNSLTQAEQHRRGKSHRLKEQNKQSQPGVMNPVGTLPWDVPFFICTPHRKDDRFSNRGAFFFFQETGKIWIHRPNFPKRDSLDFIFQRTPTKI